MQATVSPPVQYYSFFLTSILETVRLNIGECVEASYKTLTIDSARQILMFNTIDEVRPFISEKFPDWNINGDIIDLRAQKLTKSEEIPSQKLISQNLSYASELERIV